MVDRRVLALPSSRAGFLLVSIADGDQVRVWESWGRGGLYGLKLMRFRSRVFTIKED